MMTLAFVMLVITIFVGLLGLEGSADDRLIRSTGLWAWLTTGNWSAKLGAGLIILGVGALLRYLLINIDFPSELKLGSGLVISVLLTFSALALRTRPERRGLRLALAGAAGGVAYLTAYSAYALFGYVPQSTALSLLVLVAVMVGVIAVRERAQSMAVLAMMGGFIAPYFALGEAGPLVLNGYYLLLSLLVLAMVTVRSWRALIHLSFLFTLAATLFFGWSKNYYAPQHYHVMLPMLLALAGVHLAMPLLEGLRGNRRAAWLQRADEGYAWALPLAALALVFKLAPNDGGGSLAIAIALLAGVWLLGAALARAMNQSPVRYLWLAGAMLLLAAAMYLRDLPWVLLSMLIACALYASAPRLGLQTAQQGWLGLAILVLTLAHIAESAFGLAASRITWQGYVESFVLSGALLGTAWVTRRHDNGMSQVMGWAGGLWGALTLIRLLMDLHLDNWPIILFVTGLIVSGVLFLLRRFTPHLIVPATLAVWLTVSGQSAATETALPWTALAALGALLAMASLVQTTLRHPDEDSRGVIAGVVMVLLPLALWPWAWVTGQQMGWKGMPFGLTVLMTGVLISAVLARRQLAHDGHWQRSLAPTVFYLVVALLAMRLITYVERDVWSVIFELLALAYVALRAYWATQDEPESAQARRYLLIGTLTVFLFLQAQALRLWGPDNYLLTVMDLQRMAPMLLSLVWVAAGTLLTIGGHRLRERLMWSTGACLLLLAAGKIVLLDLGSSLGSLPNILAIIAAGCLFLAVSWWAPFPPARPARKPASKPERATSHTSSATSTPAHPQATAAMTAKTSSVPATATPVTRQPYAKPSSSYDQFKSDLKVLLIGAVLVGGLLMILVGYLNFQKSKYMRSAQPQPKVAQDAELPEMASQEKQRILEQHQYATRPPADVTAQKAGVAQMEQSAPELTISSSDVCAFSGVKFPNNMLVYAAGSYSGKTLDFQIDQSGHVATQFDIAVNSPTRPVALMLGSYEPAIWNISWTEGTRIAAVLVSGYHKQEVAGLQSSVPVLNSSYDNGGACGYFYVDGEQNSALNLMAQQFFGKPVDHTFTSISPGNIVVGEPFKTVTQLVTSTAVSPASFSDKSAPRAGKVGLDDAVAKGVLRPATATDIDAWVAAVAAKSSAPATPQARPKILVKAYVVLKEFTYPAGLYGANSAAFFIPVGVPSPKGNPGHSTVYYFNSLQCQGPLCGIR
ncbi:MAG: DUF2339 domain-containing protein [Methylobacillus sp.]|jgi:uncharacterized membrane protein|nr:DUF2339 domain-containing protein [Methylobacillus sp.]